MPLGFSFAPGSDIQMRGDAQGNGAPTTLSPQQAVKILSLRVPERVPSNAPINASLLNAPGGAAAGAGGLQSLIQQLIQSFKPGGVGPWGPALPATGGPMHMPQGLSGQTPALPGGPMVAPKMPRFIPSDQGSPEVAPPLPAPPLTFEQDPTELMRSFRMPQQSGQGFFTL